MEKIKSIVIKEKVAIKNLPEYIDWTKERHLGVTSIDASIRICAYKKNNPCMQYYFCLIRDETSLNINNRGRISIDAPIKY